MSQRFKIVTEGPTGEFPKIFSEPRTDSDGVFADPGGFFLKLPSDGESTEWIKVEGYQNRFDTEAKEGWVPSWALGEPIDEKPQTIRARSLANAAVRDELDKSRQSPLTVSAEYLIALFMIENGLDTPPPTLGDSTDFAVKEDRVNADAVGGYAITSEEWAAFLADEGAELGWKSPHLRALTLPQMRCVSFLTRRDWAKFATLSGGKPANPYVPRMLDLFMSRLIGPEAAAEVTRRERADEGLDASIGEILRAANEWNVGSPKEKALLANRARFLAGSGGAPVDVKGFVERCREALAPALGIGHKMLVTYLPGFVIIPSNAAQAWLAGAETEFEEWKAGGWTEQADPGQARALTFFKDTDHPGGEVTDPATGEITDWCGAFLAHFMTQAGAPVPSGAAAAANWQNWGDVALPTLHGSEIPAGAVVAMSGGSDTSKISHVCLFVDWDGDTHFIGLGGNQSDSVTKARFRSERIVSVRTIASKTASSDDDLEILAKTLYGEIRGGTAEQIRNVADVILSRFLTNYRSGGSIAGTCRSPSQFSCWNPGTTARDTLDTLPAGDAELVALRTIAASVIPLRLSKGPTFLPLQGARHYHNHQVDPNWAVASKKVHDDGKHIFYAGIA